MNFVWWNFENILVEDNKVRRLTNLYGASLVFLLHGHGAVTGEDLDRCLPVVSLP